MEELKLLPNEEAFEVKPVGIRYICEHCHEGEMVLDRSEKMFIDAVLVNPMLVKHKCTKCGGTLMLPQTYPRIEWIPVDSKKEGAEEK